MPQSSVVSWRNELDRAIKKNSGAAQSRFFQLATVDSDGIPACRTVVFRGFVQDSSTLVVHTDIRSEKVHHLKDNNIAEICWYFSETREQFRLTSKIAVLAAGEGDLAENNEHDIRLLHWQLLSKETQAGYALATPGSVILEEFGASSKTNHGEDVELKPSDNFALLLIQPFRVDHLMLNPPPQQRIIYREIEEEHWSIKRVIP